MRQPSFSDVEYAMRKRKTRREEFLNVMDEIIPFFGYTKVVYRGLMKNTHRLHVLFGSANLLMCARAGRKLLPA